MGIVAPPRWGSHDWPTILIANTVNMKKFLINEKEDKVTAPGMEAETRENIAPSGAEE